MKKEKQKLKEIHEGQGDIEGEEENDHPRTLDPAVRNIMAQLGKELYK